MYAKYHALVVAQPKPGLFDVYTHEGRILHRGMGFYWLCGYFATCGLIATFVDYSVIRDMAEQRLIEDVLTPEQLAIVNSNTQ